MKLLVVKEAADLSDTVAADGEKGFQTLLDKFPREILPTFIGGTNDFNKLPCPGSFPGCFTFSAKEAKDMRYGVENIRVTMAVK